MRLFLVQTLLVLGCSFVFLSALGILRFPDLLSRLHAASKASSLGTAAMVLATLFFFSDWRTTVQGMVIILFLYLSLPIAAHRLGRAAYQLKIVQNSPLKTDEMSDFLTEKKH